MTANKRTVYAASSGAYSDYRVRALFEDEADAKATVARMNTGYADAYVEEFDLYPPGSGGAIVARPQYLASLKIGVDGVVDGAGPKVELRSVEADEDPGGPWIGLNRWTSDGPFYEVSAEADDETRAVKAVRERAAQVAAQLAEGIDLKTGRKL